MDQRHGSGRSCAPHHARILSRENRGAQDARAHGRERTVKTRAFTLVELIAVIAILGVLAAVALPRFLTVGRQARVDSVRAFAGGLQAAAVLAQAKWIATGSTGTSVTMADGATVAVSSATGLPESSYAGIGTAMNCESASACRGMKSTYLFMSMYTPEGAPEGNCTAFYFAATGDVSTALSGC